MCTPRGVEEFYYLSMFSSCITNSSYNTCLVEVLGDFGSTLFLLMGAMLLLRGSFAASVVLHTLVMCIHVTFALHCCGGTL